MTACEVCGGLGFYCLNVPVEHPDFGKSFTCDCRKAQVQQKRMDAVLSGETGIPEEYRGRTFATWDAMPDDQKRGKQAARRVAEIFAEKTILENDYGKRWWGLVLAGETGRGKSGLAASIMYRRTELGETCLWIAFRKFLRLCYSTLQKDAQVSYEQLIGVADSVPFLVLDDFADMEQIKDITDYVRNVVYDVVCERHQQHLPTVITTNLTGEQLYDQFGDRIGDRVLQMCYWQAVGNANLRFTEGE